MFTPAQIEELLATLTVPVTEIDCGTLCAPDNDGVPICCDKSRIVPVLYKKEYQVLRARSDLWRPFRPETEQQRELGEDMRGMRQALRVQGRRALRARQPVAGLPHLPARALPRPRRRTRRPGLEPGLRRDLPAGERPVQGPTGLHRAGPGDVGEGLRLGPEGTRILHGAFAVDAALLRAEAAQGAGVHARRCRNACRPRAAERRRARLLPGASSVRLNRFGGTTRSRRSA